MGLLGRNPSESWRARAVIFGFAFIYHMKEEVLFVPSSPSNYSSTYLNAFYENKRYGGCPENFKKKIQ